MQVAMFFNIILKNENLIQVHLFMLHAWSLFFPPLCWPFLSRAPCFFLSFIWYRQSLDTPLPPHLCCWSVLKLQKYYVRVFKTFPLFLCSLFPHLFPPKCTVFHLSNSFHQVNSSLCVCVSLQQKCCRYQPKDWYMMSLSYGSASVSYTCTSVYGGAITYWCLAVSFQTAAERSTALELQKCLGKCSLCGSYYTSGSIKELSYWKALQPFDLCNRNVPSGPRSVFLLTVMPFLRAPSNASYF